MDQKSRSFSKPAKERPTSYSLLVLTLVSAFSLGFAFLYYQDAIGYAIAEAWSGGPTALEKEGRVEPSATEARPQARFAVQVAAYEERDNAEELAKQLSLYEGRRILVVPAEVKGRTYYRVRIPVETQPEAEALAVRISREQQLPTWVVKIESK